MNGQCISVCMATYNGERYIREQLNTILGQLEQDDEVVVVDDGSNDQTINILSDYRDPRIRIHVNDRNIGHVQTFGRAISLANNDIIFMSDQDDAWVEGRVSSMTKKLMESGCLLVSSNAEYTDATGRVIHHPSDDLKAVDERRHMINIASIFSGRTGYFGCGMAFRKNLTKLILPIPAFVESHDLWIALASNLMKSNAHLEDKTLFRRVHDQNASILKRSLGKKLWSRVIFIISIILLIRRSITYENTA